MLLFAVAQMRESARGGSSELGGHWTGTAWGSRLAATEAAEAVEAAEAAAAALDRPGRLGA